MAILAAIAVCLICFLTLPSVNLNWKTTKLPFSAESKARVESRSVAYPPLPDNPFPRVEFDTIVLDIERFVGEGQAGRLYLINPPVMQKFNLVKLPKDSTSAAEFGDEDKLPVFLATASINSPLSKFGECEYHIRPTGVGCSLWSQEQNCVVRPVRDACLLKSMVDGFNVEKVIKALKGVSSKEEKKLIKDTLAGKKSLFGHLWTNLATNAWNHNAGKIAPEPSKLNSTTCSVVFS